MAVNPIKPVAIPDPSSWVQQFAQQVGRYDTQTQTVNNTSPGAAANIEQLLAVLTGKVTNDAYSKDAAFKDSDAILTQIFQDFREKSLPQIYQASGQTGGYNSSTAQLMANDAFARAVAQGQAAKLKAATDYAAASAANANAASTAGRVATGINPTQMTKTNVSPLSTALGLGSLLLKAAPYAFSKDGAGKILKRKDYEASVDAGDADVVSEGIPSSFTTAGNATDSFNSLITGELNSFAGSPSNILGNSFAGGTFASDFSDAFSGSDLIGDSFLGAAADFGSDGLGGAADFFSSPLAGDIGGEVVGSAAEFGIDVGGDVLGEAIGGGIPIVGPLVNLAQGDVSGAAGSLIGGVLGGPIGAVAGGFFGDAIGGSVICTELLSQGLMKEDLYDRDITFARINLSPVMLRGYRFIGVPIVRKMRKSESFSKFISIFAIARAKSLTDKNFFGLAIRGIFEPLCFFIGLFVDEVDYSVLYTS